MWHLQAAERWQASPMNPQNGGERFPSLANSDNPKGEEEIGAVQEFDQDELLQGEEAAEELGENGGTEQVIEQTS